MRPLALRAALFFALAAPAGAGHVEVPAIEVRPGGQNAAPVPIQLSVPALTGGPAPALASALSAPSLGAPALLTPQALHPAGAAAAIPSLPDSPIVPAKPAIPGAKTPAALGGEVKPAASADAAALESGALEGRAFFDEAARPKPGWGAAIKSFFGVGEIAPAWPGKAGETVRLEGRKFTLASKLADGGGSTVWNTSSREFVAKIIHPQFMSLEHYAGEAPLLRALAKSDIPHARLVAASKDGRVMLKEAIEGATASQLLARGALDHQHVEGWPELAAYLIKNGVTADLAPGNLIWQHWRSRWVIADAGGIEDSGPAPVLKQMLTGEMIAAGVDPGAFLSGLRARLGPDSPAWAKTLAALKADPALAPHAAALAPYDARLAKAPKIIFGAAPPHGSLDDSVVKAKDVSKRLGFDPYRTKTRIKLHGEDPGKLNTSLVRLEEPGRAPVVMKTAQWSIIRNEVAGRRLARRFLGRYFRVPASVAVENGYDSYMVMENADAAQTWGGGALNREQRIAAGIFFRTFGISDVNPGNVLSPSDGGLPWLIDFEQAFGRADPGSGKHIPDERIALEKPWMSRQSPNRVEDYQPAIRVWRELLARPETQKGIADDLAAAGFSKDEAAYYLSRFNLNAADLDWTLQNDADFVNQFVARNAPRQAP